MNRHRRRRRGGELVWPWVLITIGMICLALFAGFILAGDNQPKWLTWLGFEPQAVMNVIRQPVGHWMKVELGRLVSALFLHGDWLHLMGNLAYFWVFGLTVERAVGHVRFALLFIVLGGLANLIVAWQMTETTLPVIGASGGVSAIIGVYLGLFPARRMGLWVPLGLYLQFARVPALLVIGSWFAVQLLFTVFGPISGQVAWWSHVAGFLLGLSAAIPLRLFPGVNLALRED